MKEPATEKKPVQDLNIVDPDADPKPSANGGTAKKPEVKKPADDVETLPFDSGEPETAKKEKQLPDLGS